MEPDTGSPTICTLAKKFNPFKLNGLLQCYSHLIVSDGGLDVGITIRTIFLRNVEDAVTRFRCLAAMNEVVFSIWKVNILQIVISYCMVFVGYNNLLRAKIANVVAVLVVDSNFCIELAIVIDVYKICEILQVGSNLELLEAIFPVIAFVDAI